MLEGVLLLAHLGHLAMGVQRPLKIKVKAQDGAGQKVSLSLSGWKARIFQHGEHCGCSCVILPCAHAAEHCGTAHGIMIATFCQVQRLLLVSS